MKLINVHVTNFKSVEDSEEFPVDQVTCLVGKNEAAKSAILLALAALNPHPSTPVVLEKERDYPRRHLTAYSNRHPSEEAIAVSTEWQLSDAELEQVANELGQGVIKNPVATVFRRYQAVSPEWKLDVDEPFRERVRAILSASFPTFMYFSNTIGWMGQCSLSNCNNSK